MKKSGIPYQTMTTTEARTPIKPQLPQIPLGISSYAYYWASQGAGDGSRGRMQPMDLLKRAEALGIHTVQFCENISLTELSPEEQDQLLQAAHGKGIALSLGLRGLDESLIENTLALAGRFGAKILRLVPWSGSAQQKASPLPALNKFLPKLLRICHKNKITLALENYFDLSDEELAGFVAGVSDEALGICLDTANSTGRLVDPLQTVEILAPWCACLHLKDYQVLKTSTGYRIAGAPLGQGLLNVPAALQKIRTAGRVPVIFLELWVDPLDVKADIIEKEDEWVRQSLAYLKTCLPSAA